MASTGGDRRPAIAHLLTSLTTANPLSLLAKHVHLRCTRRFVVCSALRMLAFSQVQDPCMVSEQHDPCAC